MEGEEAGDELVFAAGDGLGALGEEFLRAGNEGRVLVVFRVRREAEEGNAHLEFDDGEGLQLGFGHAGRHLE